ncbi:MAG: CAP domain-containing protein [Cereibacter changlensis]
MRGAHRLSPLVLACGLALAGQPALAQSEFLDQALDLVNASRAEADLPALETGADLVEAARAHAEDMLARDFYAHESPEGDTVQDRYIAAGGDEWELVAENIARCTGCPAPDAARIAALHEGWMNSPGHRENILRQGLARFGFAVVGGGGRDLYAVQTFAGPGQSRGDSDAAATAGEVASAALDRLNAARREAGVPALEPSPVLDGAARELAPEDLAGFSLSGIDGLQQALPPEEMGRWASIASLAGSCGGCGAALSRGDAESFVDDWLAEGAYRDRLLDPDLTHFGFVLRGDGAGRKVALALSGQTRAE